MSRVLAWFSCGDPSAVAAKLAVEKYGDAVEVVYTDTLAYEHVDNLRFMRDVEKWIGRDIKILRSKQYRDIYDVFDRTGWLIGVRGARCTTELKRQVRRAYERDGDIQVFGLCNDKEDRHRIPRMEKENPGVQFDWLLFNLGLTKRDCHRMVREAGIELPMMYRLGYKNNNCIGCVKGQAGYWNKIRVDFPEAFDRMAKQERKMDVAINKSYAGDALRKRVFLDELPPDAGRYEVEPDIECGVLCVTGQSGHPEDVPETEEVQ
jgi:3'-phosphoadenosine 5'-phosphosulfate sulfotransferase (PAPS reductase)/FAD synthetase